MKRYRLELHEKRDIAGGPAYWIWVRRARLFLTPPFCWTYREKNGHAVLRTEVTWRKLNGFQVRAGTWQLWVQWRRWRCLR